MSALCRLDTADYQYP